MVRPSHSSVALAACLLGICWVRHYAWGLFPPELRGLASKAGGGLALLGMITIVAALAPARPVFLVATWWAIEELLVVLCSITFAVRPWAVPVGQSICSARLDLDLGAIGLVALFWLCLYLHRSLYGRTTTRS